MDVFECCPMLGGENFFLRLVEVGDAADLLKVYNDPAAVPFFNSDNCNGDDFHYTTIDRMSEAVAFWDYSYKNRWFVRWAIVHKPTKRVVGTVELFNKDGTSAGGDPKDFFHGSGILRLDLRSDFERQETIGDLLSVIASTAYDLFWCDMIATKVPPFATERIKAMRDAGFQPVATPFVGNDGTEYGDYWVRRR